MFDASAQNLKIEIQAAETARDRYLSVFDRLVTQRAGTAFKDWKDKTTDEPPDFPENHIHEYLSLTVPRLVFDNPSVSVTSRRRGSPQIVAKAIEAALNDWIDRTRFYKTLEELANDTLMMWSASKLLQVPQPDTDGSSAAPHWPQVCRIPQRRFILDPLCLCPEEAVYMGEMVFRDKDDLLKEAQQPGSGWDIGAIRDLATDIAQDKTRANTPMNNGGVRRGEVAYYEIWVRDAKLEPEVETGEDAMVIGPPEVGPDQGYNGVIYTIGYGQTQYLREPRAFYGPPCGPYYFTGIHHVTDTPWPLSPVVAVYSQMDELNTQARAISLSNRHYKRIVFVDGTDPALVAQVKGGKHDYVIPLRNGLKPGEIVNVEVGGATEPQIKMLGILAERLNRVSGIQDAQRGDVSGGTATEVAIADQASETRMAHQKRVFTDYVSELLRGVAWYLCHDDRVIIPLGDDFAAENSMIEPVYFGGPYTEDGGATFDDLELEIAPYSMERTGEAMMQRNAMQAFELFTTAAPLIPQTMSFLDWKGIFEDLGRAMNNPGLADRLNIDAIGQMMGMPPVFGPQATPMMGQQLGFPPAAPRLARGAMPYEGSITGNEAASAMTPVKGV